MRKGRSSQIDVLRGIAIVLVVLEHSIGISENNIAKVILSFHMPLFFIISGLLSHNTPSNTFWIVIKKKARSLLVPQITLGCITLAYNYLVSNRILHQATTEDLNIIYCITRWWFLIVLFEINIIWELIIRIKINHKIRSILVLAICIMYMILIPQNMSGVLYILVAPVGLGFYAFGNLIKDCLAGYSKSIRSCNRLLTICVCMLVTVLTGMMNSPILMYENEYGNELLFTLSSVAGFVTLYGLSGCIEENSFFKWCGVNSIIIYVIHFSIVQATRGILIRLLPKFAYIWIVVFVVSGLIIMAGTRICSKYLRMLFGK